ncbi:hypothetical protein EBA01_09000 [Xanthomonas oryzae pv. oryzae]|nr:hypothetical protein C0L89_09000 [Xanthomonas oryzae pv. oryzae]AVU02577.1 hypothetical protein C0L90_09070 [Xanthomonas oryzae pv. oryzae]QBI12170.1 hypothetical protein EYR02_09085 [Xanthomonas oryzae pv. oryzae]QBI15821.1 hypothetical protein EYR03_09435 [Xanthomonas oryzae pv. oryzae]QBN25305.1 hypothetical protein EBA00_13445 [Xanthomonas oryzae pv. oryzae]
MCPGILTPTSAARPGPRLQHGRSKARALIARKPCLLAPRREELFAGHVGGQCRRIALWLLMLRVKIANCTCFVRDTRRPRPCRRTH